MFTRIVIGVDAVSGGEDAVALAAALAGPETELVLVSVWQGFDGMLAAALGHEPPVRLARDALERAELILDRDCRLVTREAASVGEGLHRVAEAEGADLVVVGSPSRQAPGLTLLAEDTRAALHGAPCSVAVAPRGYAGTPHDLQRVGVGYAATIEGGEAVRAARRIAVEHGGEVSALRALRLLPSLWEGGYAVVDILGDLTGRLERKARAQLAHLPDVQGRILRGDVTDELVQASRELDLLVLGSRGYGPLRRLLFGSTADHVVGRAACPVLVLARGAAVAAVAPAEPAAHRTA